MVGVTPRCLAKNPMKSNKNHPFPAPRHLLVFEGRGAGGRRPGGRRRGGSSGGGPWISWGFLANTAPYRR